MFNQQRANQGYPIYKISAQRKARTKKRGTALIEAAFIVVILLLLALGLVQYTILANTSMSLVQIAREGGRYAAVNHTSGDEEIRNYVKIAAINYNSLAIEDTDIEIIRPATPNENKVGEPIEVRVSYNLRNKLFLPSGFSLPGAHPITLVADKKTVTAVYMMQ